MHWLLIVLIVIASIALWIVGIGVALGLWRRYDEWAARSADAPVICAFLWWIVLPVMIFGLVGDWMGISVVKIIETIANKISK